MSRILLVEDDTELSMLLEHVLLGAGHQVDSADTVQAALASLEQHQYDLLVADGRLADGTGMAIAEKAQRKGAEVLIVTGYAFDLPREELARYDFLLKPVRPDELLTAIERKLHPARC